MQFIKAIVQKVIFHEKLKLENHNIVSFVIMVYIHKIKS